jgi:rhodanese-related sulfurtransferase
MPGTRKRLWLTVVRDAALVVALCCGLALAANALRSSGGIPLVAEREYEILVPCPEYEGKADPVEPDQVRPGAKGLLLVDAREAGDYARWHLPGAISIPFDYLEPTSEANVRRVLSSRARQVIVYGDGLQPDSGQELAKELGGKGLRNVKYVKGGAPALQKAGAR